LKGRKTALISKEMHSQLFLTYNNVCQSFVITKKELRREERKQSSKKTSIVYRKLKTSLRWAFRSYRDQVKRILFGMVARYTVSVINHGEIVRKDLNDRSVPCSCNATRGLRGFSFKSQVDRVIARTHV